MMFSDSNERTKTQWVWLPKGADPLPFPTCFGSTNWLPKDLTPVIGELRTGHVYSKGNDQTYTKCVGVCVDPIYLLNGITQEQKINPLGVPDCCGNYIESTVSFNHKASSIFGVGEASTVVFGHRATSSTTQQGNFTSQVMFSSKITSTITSSANYNSHAMKSEYLAMQDVFSWRAVSFVCNCHSVSSFVTNNDQAWYYDLACYRHFAFSKSSPPGIYYSRVCRCFLGYADISFSSNYHEHFCKCIKAVGTVTTISRYASTGTFSHKASSTTSNISGVNTTCCSSVPQTLKASFSNTNNAACLNNVEVTLTYTGSGSRWTGTINACSTTQLISFVCSGSTWTIGATGPSINFAASQSSYNCTPTLIVSFPSVTVSGVVNGQVTITVHS